MQQEQQSNNIFASMGSMTNIVYFVLRMFSIPITALMHFEYGTQYIGLAGVAGWILILLFPAFMPGYDTRPLAWLAFLYLVRFTIGRICQIVRFLIGKPLRQHAHYIGTPWLAFIWPDWSPYRITCFEYLLVIFVGLCLHWQNRMTSDYLALAGGSGLVLLGWMMIVESREIEEMNDAVIEQQARAERFRR